MIQTAFGLVSDSQSNVWYNDIIRIFLSLFDRVIELIPFLYRILIEIADQTIIKGEVVRIIFSRVQLILGVIMIFKLSMSVIQYIINPDMMDDKSKGLGGIISRIIIMLALLTSILPMTAIPKSSVVEGSYNSYLRDNGLLFGTLYFAQSRILHEHVIDRIILADENQNESFTSGDNAETAGNELALAILKTVYKKNERCTEDGDGSWLLTDGASGTKESYEKYDNNSFDSPGDLISDVTRACYSTGFVGGLIDLVPGVDVKADYYAYAYFPILGFVLGLFVIFTLISFCVDVAIRAIKLAILRLIAPIPIISYIDPKSGQNGAFSNWVKTLTKTYLDLFIRLAVIFLAIELVNMIVSGGLNLDMSSVTGAFATIFIIIGLFFFAKQAPQFIYEAMGMKYEKGAGIFSGLGKIAAAGSIFTGAIGSAATDYRVSRNDNKNEPLTNMGHALLGGAKGLFTGLKAGATADKNQRQAIHEAQAARNARYASGVRTFGRNGTISDNLKRRLGGESLSQYDERIIGDIQQKIDQQSRRLKAAETVRSQLSKVKDMTQEEALKNEDARGTIKVNGHEYEVNTNKLLSALRGGKNGDRIQVDGLDCLYEDISGVAKDNLIDDTAKRYAASAEGRANAKLAGARTTLDIAISNAIEDGVSINYDGEYENIGGTIGQVVTDINNIQKDVNDNQRRINSMKEDPNYGYSARKATSEANNKKK